MDEQGLLQPSLYCCGAALRGSKFADRYGRLFMQIKKKKNATCTLIDATVTLTVSRFKCSRRSTRCQLNCSDISDRCGWWYKVRQSVNVSQTLVFRSKLNCSMTASLFGSSWKILLQMSTTPLNPHRMKPARWSVCHVYGENGLFVHCPSSPLLMSFFNLQMQTPSSVAMKSSEV